MASTLGLVWLEVQRSIVKGELRKYLTPLIFFEPLEWDEPSAKRGGESAKEKSCEVLFTLAQSMYVHWPTISALHNIVVFV